MNIIWRVAGLALAAGLVLFLLTLIVKVLLVGAGLFLLARVARARFAGRDFGQLGHGGWQSSNIISIDDPTYRSAMSRGNYDRVISIS